MINSKELNEKQTAQISAQSDKVMFDRFDSDFLKACKEIDLIEEGDPDINTNDLDIHITCA